MLVSFPGAAGRAFRQPLCRLSQLFAYSRQLALMKNFSRLKSFTSSTLAFSLCVVSALFYLSHPSPFGFSALCDIIETPWDINHSFSSSSS
jgi:hypothetical protein